MTSVKIAPGAVTPAKINATGAADGVGSASWQPSGGGGVSYVRTVVVSLVLNAGLPDAVGSGTALLAAMAGITASATDPYLLKIEPGVYDLGLGWLTMKPYVDIEGSGEVSTTITSTISSTTVGTVVGADNAELRFITVQNRYLCYSHLQQCGLAPAHPCDSDSLGRGGGQLRRVQHQLLLAGDDECDSDGIGRVGASQLDGVVANPGGGTFTCVGAYSATFIALTAGCL